MSDQINLRKLHEAVKFLSNEVDPQLSLLAVNAMLTVALDAGVNSISELKEALKPYGGTRSNTSRNLSFWLDIEWRRPNGDTPEGLDYIKTMTDPDDFRQKKLFTTKKGQAFLDRLDAVMEA